jgi:hypothetical protein
MIILWSIFVGVLSYELIYSDLAFYVKKALFLDKYYPQIELLSSWKFYPKFLGKYLYLLFPFCLMILILSNLHRFTYSLLQCPYCTAIHVGFWTGLVLLYPIPMCILLGFLGSFITAIYSRLRS